MEQPIVADNKPVAVDLVEGRSYFFCACGHSKKQPFCDGAHAGTGLTPVSFKAEKSGRAFLCACKQSSNIPFCDGSHQQVKA